jgi:hypothetical protein
MYVFFGKRGGFLATTVIWHEKIQIKKEKKNAIQFK